MYKFCKANGCWWHVCNDLAKLLEHQDKTSSRFGIALIKGCEKEPNQYDKYNELAKMIAENKGTSMLMGMTELAGSISERQIKYMTEGDEIWINSVGGWNCGLQDIEATVYMKNLIYPNCKKKDIKITKFGGYEGGKHYYAKIGEIEVCQYVNGEKIIKWNTYDEAYEQAMKYCEELE